MQIGWLCNTGHGYCLIIVMQDLKNIETLVLLTMIAAHSSYYGRALSVSESQDCQATISQLQAEVALRKEAQRKLLLPDFN